MKRISPANWLGLLLITAISLLIIARVTHAHLSRAAQVNQAGSSAHAGEAEIVPGEVLVKFRSDAAAGEAARGERSAKGRLYMPSSAGLTKLFDEFGVTKALKPFA